MSHLVVKVTLNHSPSTFSTRKMTLSRVDATGSAPFATLVTLIKERFSLPPDCQIALLYIDPDDEEAVTLVRLLPAALRHRAPY